MPSGFSPLPRRSPTGFTLIELSIVIFVIAIITGIAIPRLRDLTAVELGATTRRISNTARYLSEESAFRGRVYALNIDLDNQAFWVTRFDQKTGQFDNDDSLLSRRAELPPDVRIADVVLPNIGKIAAGVAATFFYPEGFADPTVIHLVDGRENAFTIRIDPARGWGEIFDGYQDFEIRS